MALREWIPFFCSLNWGIKVAHMLYSYWFQQVNLIFFILPEWQGPSCPQQAPSFKGKRHHARWRPSPFTFLKEFPKGRNTWPEIFSPILLPYSLHVGNAGSPIPSSWEMNLLSLLQAQIYRFWLPAPQSPTFS